MSLLRLTRMRWALRVNPTLDPSTRADALHSRSTRSDAAAGLERVAPGSLQASSSIAVSGASDPAERQANVTDRPASLIRRMNKTDASPSAPVSPGPGLSIALRRSNDPNIVDIADLVQTGQDRLPSA